MNKKGFTLVELLAVVVILALLALLTSTAVTKLVKDAKNDLSETQMTLIKSAADTWMSDNLNKLPSSGSCAYLTLEDLKYYGLLDNTILDPKNSEEIPNDLKIKITTTTSAYGNPVSTTEVNPESIEGCSQIYFPVCTIAGDSTVTGLNAGAKYNCKVDPNKDEYTFYVLTSVNANATTVNLIMDSNIRIDGEAVKEENPTEAQKGLVAWINNEHFLEMGGVQADWDNSENLHIYGPITPIKYLQSATSSWTNVNEQTISTFTDHTGSTYKMTQTFNLNARLPHYNELSNVSSTAIYLIDYLHGESNEGSDTGEKNTVNNVYGYWTLSSSATDSSYACYVNYAGNRGSNSVKTANYYGVRPVITVPINRIIQTNQ